MIQRFFQGVLRWAALMGFLVKDDETIEQRDPDREWGPPSQGFLLSAKAREDKLSVVLKNTSTEVLQTTIPGWLFFYRLDIKPAPQMTTFGERTLAANRDTSTTELVLRPGKSIESELPVGMLYVLQPDQNYTVTVSCEISGLTVVSNEAVLRA